MNIELIGVAGAGKSTLVRELCAKAECYQHCRRPSYGSRILHGLVNRICIMGDRDKPLRKWKWLTRDEYRSLTYLQRWYRMYGETSHESDRVVLFDQGPVSRFAMMRDLGSKNTKTKYFQAWLAEWRERWLQKLGLIVWLDAPSEILLQRVLSRSQPHPCKSLERHEAIDSMNGYGEAYRRILTEIDASGVSEVMHFDTSIVSTAETANLIHSKLNAGNCRLFQVNSTNSP